MNNNITTYLNDHLAGSVAALELISDLIKASDDASLKQFLANLKCDIEADQKILERLLDAADRNQSVMRKAAAWVSEKFAGAKFKVASEDLGGLGARWRIPIGRPCGISTLPNSSNARSNNRTEWKRNVWKRRELGLETKRVAVLVLKHRTK
jgi:hypothetical protein